MIKDKNYKLPSYASCLNAQINPQNFQKLKNYFEVAVKDQKIAQLNYKKLVKAVPAVNTQKIRDLSFDQRNEGRDDLEAFKASFMMNRNLNDKYQLILQEEKLKRIISNKVMQRGLLGHRNRRILDLSL